MTNPVSVPERWDERLKRLYPTIEPGKWPKRYQEEAKELELQELRALLAAPAAAPSQDDVRDAERLDFMLCNHRKVVVERIPGGRLEIYVEEGFMGDKEYPSVKHRGEWRDGSEAANAIKRAAIDKALAHQHEQEKGDE